MKEMTMTKLAALSVICAAIVLVLAVGLALLADHLIGQRQEAAQPAEQVQPQEEKEKETVWQLHAAANTHAAWRINTQTGYVEFLHPGDQDFNKHPVVKFPAPTK